jgi:hypothetical protein
MQASSLGPAKDKNQVAPIRAIFIDLGKTLIGAHLSLQ